MKNKKGIVLLLLIIPIVVLVFLYLKNKLFPKSLSNTILGNINLGSINQYVAYNGLGGKQYEPITGLKIERLPDNYQDGWNDGFNNFQTIYSVKNIKAIQAKVLGISRKQQGDIQKYNIGDLVSIPIGTYLNENSEFDLGVKKGQNKDEMIAFWNDMENMASRENGNGVVKYQISVNENDIKITSQKTFIKRQFFND